MKKNKILLIILTCFSLTACQSIKEGLSGSKSENSDEFLVKKKNPLVLPPKYLELPKPQELKTENVEASSNQDNFDIKEKLGIKSKDNKLSTTEIGDAEEFVLKNIK